jgi:hypothetical protein
VSCPFNFAISKPNHLLSFFPLFRFIYQLTDDEESVKIATKNIIDEFANDGVRYLELRTTPRKNEETGMVFIEFFFAQSLVYSTFFFFFCDIYFNKG